MFQAKRCEQPSMTDRMKGYRLQGRLGTILSDMTSDEWFALAEEYDQTYRDVGPFDVTAPHFIQKREDCLSAAAFVDMFPGVTPR